VQIVVLDLNHIVEGMTKMLHRLVDEQIEMTFVYGREMGGIKADAGYVWQVLMNLIVNARDAMPEGGKLGVETGWITREESCDPEHYGVTPGDYVTLSVSDTGMGMTGDVKARMFEAFFTTKALGNGTGLGLATCRTIVQQCGGHIGVHSELGRGTTIKVYFPKIDQPIEIVPRIAQVTVPVLQGTETLLVVEDEPALRRLTQEGLKALGYNVLTATNGQDALRVVREYQGLPISMVVTDVMMPRMDGKMMAEWLKTKHPHLKILFVSGYMDSVFAQTNDHGPGIAFLPKPYTPAKLAGEIRKLLDSGGTVSAETAKNDDRADGGSSP
jgi:two-component system cell cycle sensor histidine kinase/response regulator CckA